MMPLSAESNAALKLLQKVRQEIEVDDPGVKSDLNLLISVLENPVFQGMLTIQDSLKELKKQLQQHPSILAEDFDITPAGKLVLNLPDEEVDQPSYQFDAQDQISNVSTTKASPTNSAKAVEEQVFAAAAAAPVPLAEEPPAPISTESYAEEFRQAIAAAANGKDVHYIELFKPEGSTLGFSVVGLKSEFRGELGIFIQEIQSSGIAAKDGGLWEGDRILAIDGQPLDSNISHQQAISILQKARGKVELVVARDPPPRPSSTEQAAEMLNTEWAQVEAIDLMNDGSGLGFGIIGGRSTGVVVKTILPAGVADRDGRLQSGDHILQIGDVNLRGRGSEQVASVLRQSGSHVRLVVARPVDAGDATAQQGVYGSAPIVPTCILNDPEQLEQHLLSLQQRNSTENEVNGLPAVPPDFLFTQEPTEPIHSSAEEEEEEEEEPIPPPLPAVGPPISPEPELLPEMETFDVELTKDKMGLGITIAGYICEKEELSGIFVKSINPGSAASTCGKIQLNDQIVEVDGRSLTGFTNHEAVDLLRGTGIVVQLKLARYLRGPKYEQLQHAIATSESTPSLNQASFSDSVDGVELAEATNPMLQLSLEDLEAKIDTNYSGEIDPMCEAAIIAKWSADVGPEFNIIVSQLSKLKPGGGLGISLEGTVDVEDGKEVRPHHYIRSVLPDGPVGMSGKLRSGDELFEVNGRKLLGLNHVEVVGILKELPMDVRMVVGRRAPDMAPPRLFDPGAHNRAVFAHQGLLSGSVGNLVGLGERLVKAKSDGSLASSNAATTDTTSFSRLKSRSLEPLTGLAMWGSQTQLIELVKGDRGLGFSILDYQDPMNPNETVIVIRSLVPGGVAKQDGRLNPGDRLMFVNDTNLENATLDQAVQALKGAARGVVRIGVAKPLPLPDSAQHSQDALDLLQEMAEKHSSSSSTTSASTTSISSSTDIDQDMAQSSKDDIADIVEYPPPPAPSSLPPLSDDGHTSDEDSAIRKIGRLSW